MVDQQHDAADPAYRVIGGRYRLESSIGRGAMGTVWSSTDELLHRPVAVKELKLSPELPEDDAAELQERALREARAMAVLAHPNVVMLYDVAWEGNRPFVVMELVAAQSLAKILDVHDRLDVQQLALLIDGVAAALQAAHRIGIVHRDVKPGNVLVGRDGQVKLSDFGVARNGADPTITRSGYVMGTPAFIAPELAIGDNVATSADLWSLGTMVFMAAEGRLPYDNSTDPLITISSIINGNVPQHRQTGPIGEVISGLMVKDPAQRMPLEKVRRLVQHSQPEAGTNPFGHLLDHNAPALRSGDATTRTNLRGDRAGAAPQPRPDGGARAPKPPTSGSPGQETTSAKGAVAGKSRRSAVMMGAAAGALIVLVGAAGFVAGSNGSLGIGGESGVEINNGPGWKPARPMTPGNELRNAYTQVQAEQLQQPTSGIDYASGQDNDGSRVIGPMTEGDQLLYQSLDFGSAPAREFAARLASRAPDSANGVLEIRVDGPDTEPIGKLAVTSSGGWQTWKTVPINISPVAGVHDVYLSFTADAPGDIACLNWFQFHR